MELYVFDLLLVNANVLNQILNRVLSHGHLPSRGNFSVPNRCVELGLFVFRESLARSVDAKATLVLARRYGWVSLGRDCALDGLARRDQSEPVPLVLIRKC